MHSENNTAGRSEFDRTMVNRFDRMQIFSTKPPTGLSRPKSRPVLLKSTQAKTIPITTKLVPRPPTSKKPSSGNLGPHLYNMKKPNTRGMLVRKFYDVRKEDLVDEDRVSGDGEASVECNETGPSSWEKERIPGDGCFSDIAEEDEEGGADEDNFVAEEDAGIENLDDDYYECDELDEAGFSDDGDDTASQHTQSSSAASSRASTARSRFRVTSARTRAHSTTDTSSNGRQSLSGMSKPLSDASSVRRNSTWISTDEDQVATKPALMPSLFTHRLPTVYFTVEGEKVAPLPSEVRKLLKWKMSSITPNIIKQCIARSGFKPTKRSSDWLGYWGKHMKANCFKSVRDYQMVNHFPGTFQIGRKDRLWRNMSRMMVHHGRKEYGFVPQTFVLPYDVKLLKRVWDDGGSRQKWILKPPASARGIGIRVIHKWNQIPRKRPVVVQRYLHKPFLINGSKFDLRIYVYISSYDPLRVYIFEDGLVRFATCKYSSSMKNLSNKFMHLTNYSINKKNEGAYKANPDETVCQGHKWSLKALWGYMKRMGINHSHVWEGIKDVVVKTIIASDAAVNTLIKQNVRRRYSVHELFGFDVMLDENLKPWLLEVNISPSLHSTSQLDKNIKGQMIKDLFNIAGFQIPENVVTSSTSSTSNMNTFSQDKSVALRTDERAKRAFYIQRFLDEHTKQSILDVLTPDDINILMETEDEYSRKGCFQRAFPSPTYNKYLRFFETQRYYNILLDEWTRKFMREGRSSALGVAILRSYAEQKLHVGGHVSNPAHQWSAPQGVMCRSSSAPATGFDQGPIKASSSAPVLLPKIKKRSTKTNSTKKPARVVQRELCKIITCKRPELTNGSSNQHSAQSSTLNTFHKKNIRTTASNSTVSSEKTKQMTRMRIKSTI